MNNRHSSIQSIALNNIYRPNCEGILCIRKTLDISVAYLAKRGLKNFEQPSNMWVQLVKAKYFNNHNHNILQINEMKSALLHGKAF